jgi:uncharacterized protein (DUF433 family)
MQFTRISPDTRMSGVPCIRDTRIPVAIVMRMLHDGVKAEEIIDAFPNLDREDLAEARRYSDEDLAQRCRDDEEVKKLVRQSRHITIYLIAATLLTFFVGYHLVRTTDTNTVLSLLSVALIGFSGSGMAALTSSLDRYANGFELRDGRKQPKEAKRDTFNCRMGRWFYVRPFVGFVVAPVLLWGIEFFVNNPDSFRGTHQHVAFTAFVGGLLAKSVLELIKKLFKNVFNV